MSCKEDILISHTNAVTALDINPMVSHHLAVGCADSTVRIYDRRCLTTQGAGNNWLYPIERGIIFFLSFFRL